MAAPRNTLCDEFLKLEAAIRAARWRTDAAGARLFARRARSEEEAMKRGDAKAIAAIMRSYIADGSEFPIEYLETIADHIERGTLRKFED